MKSHLQVCHFQVLVCCIIEWALPPPVTTSKYAYVLLIGLIRDEVSVTFTMPTGYDSIVRFPFGVTNSGGTLVLAGAVKRTIGTITPTVFVAANPTQPGNWAAATIPFNFRRPNL